MTRYGVKYPDGTWSGPITESHRDAARYARLYHGTVYEEGGAEDPCPRHRLEAEPWDFGDMQQVITGTAGVIRAAIHRQQSEAATLAAKF